MTRFRATLAYDGTAYQGFQRQAGETPTIQRAVEQAITAVTGQAVTVIGAGRTDSGVHATGQVIAFDAEWPHDDRALLRALNVTLPDDIALQDIIRQDGFHPRFDAVSRVYNYKLILSDQRQPLLNRLAWHVYGSLDGAAMQQAAKMLIGEHDFAAFGKPPRGENTVRTVFRSEWQMNPRTEETRYSKWVYTVEANAFLEHMVRRIVGALVNVGRGKWRVDEFRAAFERAQLLTTMRLAPPQGLVLARVFYPDEGMQDKQQAGETPAGESRHG